MVGRLETRNIIDGPNSYAVKPKSLGKNHGQSNVSWRPIYRGMCNLTLKALWLVEKTVGRWQKQSVRLPTFLFWHTHFFTTFIERYLASLLSILQLAVSNIAIHLGLQLLTLDVFVRVVRLSREIEISTFVIDFLGLFR